VVLDVGSWKTRAGFAGDDEPQIQTITAVVNSDGNIDYNPANHSHYKSVEFPVVRGKSLASTHFKKNCGAVLSQNYSTYILKYSFVAVDLILNFLFRSFFGCDCR
jgi:actin-related protein